MTYTLAHATTCCRYSVTNAAGNTTVAFWKIIVEAWNVTEFQFDFLASKPGVLLLYMVALSASVSSACECKLHALEHPRVHRSSAAHMLQACLHALKVMHAAPPLMQAATRRRRWPHS